LKKYGISFTIFVILGNLNNYNKSLWRLSLIHTLSSFIFSKTLDDRKLDIYKTYHIYLPTKKAEKEKDNIIKSLYKINNDDISTYLDVYLSFGKYLLPRKY